MLSATADYGLYTATCQVAILFRGVGCAPPQKKNEVSHLKLRISVYSE